MCTLAFFRHPMDVVEIVDVDVVGLVHLEEVVLLLLRVLQLVVELLAWRLGVPGEGGGDLRLLMQFVFLLDFRVGY